MLGALMAEARPTGSSPRCSIIQRPNPWMMALVAIIVGLPLSFEIGLVMMVPIIFVMARRSKQPILRIVMPALAGMKTLHALLPLPSPARLK